VSEEALARRYRPATFREMGGQPAVAGVMWRFIHDPETGQPRKVPRVPQALLLTGTRGTGKTTSARILGAALNCEADCERPCTKCPSCEAVREGTSLAVVEIDAASNGNVDQVHKLQELVSYDVQAPYRVVILDEVHGMSAAGIEALLKLLEEPPPRTVFALLTTERGKVKDTIFSRCSAGLFSFRRISPDDIAKRLDFICAAEGIDAEPALVAALAERADGSLRDGVMLLDQVHRAEVTKLVTFEQMHGEQDFAPWLIAHMIMGDYASLFEASDRALSQTGDYRFISAKLTACLKDMLVLHNGGSVAAQGEALTRRRQLVRRSTPDQVCKVMALLWDLATRARSADPRSALELALFMGAQVFHPTGDSVPVAVASTNGNGHGPVAGSRPATLEELRAAAQ
jgi:DNA polymerase-3 subunit gamma/tau